MTYPSLNDKKEKEEFVEAITVEDGTCLLSLLVRIGFELFNFSIIKTAAAAASTLTNGFLFLPVACF